MRVLNTKNINLLTGDDIAKSTDFAQNSDLGVFSLERTAIKLSGNQKLVVNGDLMYFESLTDSSAPQLKININESFTHNLYRFFGGYLDKGLIWDTSIIDSAQNSSTYSSQYNNITIRGARTIAYDKISTSKEQKRFFAPLYTFGNLPDRFILLRLKNTQKTTNSSKFNDLISDAEYVASYSLDESSVIGKFLRTLTNSQYFRKNSLIVDYSSSTIHVNGIDVNTGKLVQKKVDATHIFANELTVTEFNNTITNMYVDSGLISQNLINLEFVFEDPSAPNGFNSYIGLYVNEHEVSEHQAKFIKLNYEKESIVGIKKNSKEYKILKVEDKSSYTFNDFDIKKYDDKVFSKQFRRIEADTEAVCDIVAEIKPIVGTKFSIFKNNKLIYEFIFSSDILQNKTREDVLIYLAKDITKNLGDYVMHATVDKNLLRIVNEDFSFDEESIVVSLPTSMKKKNQTKTWFVSLKHKTDIIVSSTESMSFDSIHIDDKKYTPTDTFIYKNLNIIRLDRDLPRTPTNYASFSKSLDPKYFVLQLIDHVDFDRFRYDHHANLLNEYTNRSIKNANCKNVLCVNWVAFCGNNSTNTPLYLNNSLSFGINDDLPVASIPVPLSKSISVTRNKSIHQSILIPLSSSTYDPQSLMLKSNSNNEIYPSGSYAVRVTDKHYYVLIDGVEYHIQENLENYKIYPIILNEPVQSVTEPITFVKNDVYKCAFILFSQHNYKSRKDKRVKIQFDIFKSSETDDKIYQGGSIRRFENKPNSYTWYQSHNGEPVFRVGYPQGSIDIQDIKNDNRLEWYISKTNDSEAIFKITAEDIVEATSDHLWCKDIIIELYPNTMTLIKGENRADGKSRSDTIRNEFVTIDGVVYRIPFWKYFAAGETKLSIKNRYFLCTTDEIYSSVFPESEDLYTKTGEAVKLKSFIESPKITAEDKLLLVNGSDLFQHNQIWHQVSEMSMSSYYNVPEKDYLRNFTFSTTVYEYLEKFPSVDTLIIDASGNKTKTSTNISITKHTSVPLITNLTYSNVLGQVVRRDEPLYANVIRYSGQYSPLFVKILDAKPLNTLPNIIMSTDSNTAADYSNLPERWLDKKMTRHNQRILFNKSNTHSDGDYIVSKRFFYRSSGDEVLVNDLPIIVPTTTPYQKRSINQIVIDNKTKKLYTWSNNLKELVSVVDIDEFTNNNKVWYSFDKSCVPDKLIDQPDFYLVSSYSDDNDSSLIMKKNYAINPSIDPIYKLKSGNIIIDVEPNVAFAEIPGFVSSCFTFNGTFEAKIICTGDTIDLVSLIKYLVGLSFNKKYQYITDGSVWSYLFEPLKYYYNHLTDLNISLNDVYDLMFRRFYEEFFYKKYSVEEVRNDSNQKIRFEYKSMNELLIQLPPNHINTVLTVKFSKK